MRAKLGLRAMEAISVNLDLDEKTVLCHFKQRFDIVEKMTLGTYYLLTRVLYPAIVYPENPDARSRFKEIAARLTKEIGEDAVSESYSRHLCVVGRKI